VSDIDKTSPTSIAKVFETNQGSMCSPAERPSGAALEMSDEQPLQQQQQQQQQQQFPVPVT
jgi:hypothetical protein